MKLPKMVPLYTRTTQSMSTDLETISMTTPELLMDLLCLIKTDRYPE